MISNVKNNEANQKKVIDGYLNFFKYAFGIAAVWGILIPIIFIIFNEIFIALEQRMFGFLILLLILPNMLIALTAMFYISPVFWHMIKGIVQFLRKKENTFLISLKTILNENYRPTTKANKVRRIILWGLSGSAVISMIGFLIFLTVIAFAN